MRITKFWLNNPLMFLLVIAFLAVQWTTTHIHLAEQHTHEGSHHQHQIEAHAHDLIDQHTAVIDSSHHANHIDIIEISHDYRLPKIKKPHAVAVFSIFQSLPCSLAISIKIPINLNSKLSHLERITVNPRAPPITS